MQRRLIWTVATTIMLLCSACGSAGGDANTGGKAADSGVGAAADVEGVPSGCGAVFDVAAGPIDTATGNMTAERLELFKDSAEQARDSFEDESAAVGQYFQLMVDMTEELRRGLEGEPDITPEGSLQLFEREFNKRGGEFAALQIETIAFLDRRCDADLSNPVALDGSRPDRRPDDELAEDAVSMDGGDNDGQDAETNGERGAGTDDGQEAGTDDADPVATAAPTLDVETTSAGATGTYWSIDIEVGEVWRTNQEPAEALTKTNVGTDQSWVMVEVRMTNDLGGDTGLGDNAFRWLDEQGGLTAPVAALTPQGNEWSLNFPPKSSERGYLVYPGDVGQTDGASLQVVGQDAVSETIPLGVGSTSSPYPIDIATGQTGSATIVGNSCSWDVETDVRGAQIGLNGTIFDRWQRPEEGQRFVLIDLGLTNVEADGPLGCFTSVALFQLEARLELSNGDTVAPANKNFAAVEEGATDVDQLLFTVADDITSMTLKAGDGNVLAQWDGITVPQP